MDRSSALSYVKTITGFCLLISVANSLFCLISLFNNYFVYSLSSIPYYILEIPEPWRLLTSFFSTFSFLELLILLPCFISVCTQTEKQIGTLRYSLFLPINCILIQLIYICASFLFPSLYTEASHPLWGQLMTEILLMSRKSPESSTQFLCCPGRIKSFYYPYLFFAIFAVLGRPAELTAGVLMGILSKIYTDTRISLMNLQRSRIEALEKNVFFACLSALPGFIQIADAGQEVLPFTFVHADSVQYNPSRSSDRAGLNNFQEFIDEDSL